jgi:hypothetical protein
VKNRKELEADHNQLKRMEKSLNIITPKRTRPFQVPSLPEQRAALARAEDEREKKQQLTASQAERKPRANAKKSEKSFKKLQAVHKAQDAKLVKSTDNRVAHIKQIQKTSAAISENTKHHKEIAKELNNDMASSFAALKRERAKMQHFEVKSSITGKTLSKAELKQALKNGAKALKTGLSKKHKKAIKTEMQAALTASSAALKADSVGSMTKALQNQCIVKGKAFIQDH